MQLDPFENEVGLPAAFVTCAMTKAGSSELLRYRIAASTGCRIDAESIVHASHILTITTLAKSR